MRIEAYDLATRVGIAWGEGGSIPRSDSFRLSARVREDDATNYDFAFEKCASLQRYLFKRWRYAVDRPDLVVIEHPIAFQRGAKPDEEGNVQPRKFLGGIDPGALLPWMLAATTCSLASSLGMAVAREWRGAITSHFLGKGRVPRGELKARVVQRCHLLGYLPKDCKDEDRADACALWDLAQAKFGRRIPQELVMFGEQR